jgi:hypothetical protein
MDIITLTDEARRELVEKKAACPFLGPLVATRLLPVHNDEARPLASIDDVIRLGNSGGGNLGEVLEIFAQGNHAFMPGPSGALDQPVPSGYFSLDLPGSQGSHPGHSGILQGDSKVTGSGRFSQEDFNRLTSFARDGLLKRSDIGRFIAGNVSTDPQASVIPPGRLLFDILDLVSETPHALIEWVRNKARGTHEAKEERELFEKLTKAAAASNLVGSCGEFGLLLAFLEHKPGARTLDGEPAVFLDDLTSMFVHKTLPDGWEHWPKTAKGWVTNTLALLQSATSSLSRSGARAGIDSPPSVG